MTKLVTLDATTCDGIDQNFASPKRKDCKLDTDLLPSSTTTTTTNERATKTTASIHTAHTTNGKRNHKNLSGSKTKKTPQAITKYFHTNGHNESDSALTSSDNEVNKSGADGQIDDGPVQFNGITNGIKNTAVDECKQTVPILNGSVLMSPEAKSLQNGGGGKQTTPHRIVVRSSPTKKQRLYVKDPVEVFSNLNIRDGGSKGAKKGKQKTRRKLNVTENENHQNGVTVANTIKNDEPVVNGETVKSSSDSKLTTSKAIDDASENAENCNEKAFRVPTNPLPRRVHDTQLTDYFPIRRSGRKTKKAVEQEISQQIEMAIEKQLEDGLIVKNFPEKGRGIVAGRPFQRGEFVVEYIGELIDQTEADRREEDYAQKADFGCYMYYFKHKEQQWW